MAIGWMRNGGRDPENNLELTPCQCLEIACLITVFI